MIGLADFTQTVELSPGVTREWRYQVVALDSLARVQLWFLFPGTTAWEIGHGKNVPAGMTPADVANAMRAFVLGEISGAEYNELVP